MLIGQAQLAVKTLNTNYDLDVQEYVIINFSGLERIIDKLGGLSIDVKSYEINETNKYIRELNRINGGTWVDGIGNSGVQTLKGRQAVAYARIRKVGDGDTQRTERQRMVLEKVIDKLFQKSHSDLLSLAYEFMPYVKTSVSINELAGTAKDYNKFKDAKIEQYKYPEEYYGGIIRGAWVAKPLTLESNVRKLMKFIYETDEYTPSAKLKEISKEIENM